jgi:hypothetical protein
VHVFVVQRTQYRQITGTLVLGDQCSIVLLIGFGGILYKLQTLLRYNSSSIKIFFDMSMEILERLHHKGNLKYYETTVIHPHDRLIAIWI